MIGDDPASVRDASAWTAADFVRPRGWAVTLGADMIAEIEALDFHSPCSAWHWPSL